MAPTKTDADVAQAAEEMRRKMALSTNGFGADFKTTLGSSGSGAQPAPLAAVTLGS